MRRNRACLAALLLAGASCRQLLGIDTPIAGRDDGMPPPPPADAPRDAPADAAIDGAGLGSSLEFVEGSAVGSDQIQTIIATLGSAIELHDLIVLAIGSRDPAMAIQKVSDTLGSDTFEIGAPLHASTTKLSSEMRFAVATAAGGDRITVAFTKLEPFVDLRVGVYRGVIPPVTVGSGSVLDVAASSDGTVGDAAVTVTTTQAGDLVVAADYSTADTTGPGPGMNLRELTKLDDILEDELGAAAGDYSASAALAGDGDWVMQACAFVVTPAQ